MNRENLKKLANYLESLPEDYSHFDMRSFILKSRYQDPAGYWQARSDEVNYATMGGLPEYCGTAACAVGHGPAAGITLSSAYLYGNNMVVDWARYSLACFTEEATTNTALWSFLFGSKWVTIDNHHWGAAARIRYILDGNEVGPDDPSVYYSYDKRYP